MSNLQVVHECIVCRLECCVHTTLESKLTTMSLIIRVEVGLSNCLFCDLYSIEPKMKHLHELVIPKIHTHWKKVAACLSYSQDTIQIMDEKWESINTTQCCEDLLRDWLCTDDSVHPHSWETLITILKEVKQLNKTAKQIEKDLEKLIRYIAR